MLNKQIIWVGIDVGKKESVCAIDWHNNQEISDSNNLISLPIKSIANTSEGVKRLFNWLKANKKDIEEQMRPQRQVVYQFVMEPTGCYSNLLIEHLKAKKKDVYIALVNPGKMPAFKMLINVKTKTHKLDAQCLARLGSIQKPKARYEMPKDYAGLRHLTLMRSQLVRAATIFKNQLKSMDVPGERLFFQSPLDSVKSEIKNLDDTIKAYLKQHHSLQRDLFHLISIPGIGIVVAATLLAEYGPKCRFINVRQIVSFAGLNPKNKFSGTSVKSTHLSKQGSPIIREVLYSASLTAQPRIPLLDELSKRLIKLTPMQKRCAVMRKLLTICWSVLHNDRDYMEYQPSSKKLIPLSEQKK
ncbi:MAG: transposase [Lentisphaeria bacterium]